MLKQQIGVVGVGVMGKSLALNFESKGYSVALYDISKEKVNEIIEENRGKTWLVLIWLKSLLTHLNHLEKFC